MDSKGIDVTLRMDWLTKHKGIIDYARKAVQLTHPNGAEVVYVAKALPHDKKRLDKDAPNKVRA